MFRNKPTNVTNNYTTMCVDSLNIDDVLDHTTGCEDNSSFHRSNDRCVGKHTLSDTPDSQFADSPAKRMRSSPKRISCKARGLSNKHTDDNAYLEIPIDAPHGLPLTCSHPECAGSGRRFRYCQGEQTITHMRHREGYCQTAPHPFANHSLRGPSCKAKFPPASWPWNG